MKRSNDNICIRLDRDTKQIDRCKAKVAEISDSVSDLSKILSLTGNEVRMKILFLLQEEEKLCVCDLGEILEMKTPAISQHLRKLKDAKMVVAEREGVTIYYHIHPERKPDIALMLNMLSEVVAI